MIKITKRDIIWNYAGSILNIGMSFFILPFVLTMLSSHELGLWYVFGSLSALVALVDFGFSPTIMRNITYVWSGAKELMPEGTPSMEINGKPNYSLLNSIISASRKIYLILSIISGLLLLTLGTLYIQSLLEKNEMQYLVAWIIYAVAIFLNLFYSYWTPLLKGIGAIKEANQVLVISRTIYVVFAIVGLLFGGGLIWLSLMYLISGLLLGLLSKRFFLKIILMNNNQQKTEEIYSLKTIFSIVWPNAKKQGIVTIGAWLITRSSTLICSTYLGLETTAKYGLSLQVLGVVGSFSSLLFNSYAPEIAYLKVNNYTQRYKQIFSRAIALQWIVGLIGIAFVLMLGPSALRLIGSNSVLLSKETLIILAIILFLEWNHSTFATLITISNTVPFVSSSIYSGIGIIVLSYLTVEFTNYGILGVVLAQGFVQLVYNNWRWPLWVFKENDSSVLRVIRDFSTEISDFKLRKIIKHKN